MKFDNEVIVENFIKGIKSSDFHKNLGALRIANELMADGSDIDFQELLIENEGLMSERLAEVLTIFPFEPENYEFYKGGESALNHFYEVLIRKPSNTTILDERKTIVENLEEYFDNLPDHSANEISRNDLNISKTEFELFKKMSEADEFDPSIAIAITTNRELFDELRPDYVRESLSVDDVKAMVSALDRNIDEQYTFSALSHEVAKFVKATQNTTKAPEQLFMAMTVFANASVYGVDEQMLYTSLLQEEKIDEKVLEKYFSSLDKPLLHRRAYMTEDEIYASEFDREFDVLENDEDEPKRKRKYSI